MTVGFWKVGGLEAEWVTTAVCPQLQSAAGCMWVVGRV